MKPAAPTGGRPVMKCGGAPRAAARVRGKKRCRHSETDNCSGGQCGSWEWLYARVTLADGAITDVVRDMDANYVDHTLRAGVCEPVRRPHRLPPKRRRLACGANAAAPVHPACAVVEPTGQPRRMCLAAAFQAVAARATAPLNVPSTGAADTVAAATPDLDGGSPVAGAAALAAVTPPPAVPAPAPVTAPATTLKLVAEQFGEWRSLQRLARSGAGGGGEDPLPVTALPRATPPCVHEPSASDVLQGLVTHGCAKGRGGAGAAQPGDCTVSVLDSRFVLPSPCEFVFGDVRALTRPSTVRQLQCHCNRVSRLIEPAPGSEHATGVPGDHGPALAGAASAPLPRYRLAVVDPPWPNKSVRRSRKYRTMTLRQLQGLARCAMGTLLRPGAVVAVWVTHDPAALRMVRDTWFPAWGVEYRAVWCWLKVAANGGHPVVPVPTPPGHVCTCDACGVTRDACDTPAGTAPDAGVGAAEANGGTSNSRGTRDARKPWEMVVLGVRQSPGAPLPTSGATLPRHSVAFAAPPVAHSVKPALAPLLAEWLPRRRPCAGSAAARQGDGSSDTGTSAPACACCDVDCLELFARRLRAGWTSVGDQCLLFQAEDLYDAPRAAPASV